MSLGKIWRWIFLRVSRIRGVFIEYSSICVIRKGVLFVILSMILNSVFYDFVLGVF